MASQYTYNTVALADLHAMAEAKKADGWRYVQTMCVATDDGIDIIYSFNKEDKLDNMTVKAVQKTDEVPSISDLFFSAFVFENEAHDLFGVNITNIAIDFGGNFYALSQREPMTIISPEKKAAKEKAAKLAAAKAAKEAKEKAASNEDAEMEAKLAAMDPEKAAKVRAAMAAKKAKEAKAAEADKADDMEAKLAAMDPEKAAKVRAAMEAKAKKEAAAKQAEKDAELEAKLAAMDPEKAAKVRAAMAAKAAKEGKAE